MENPNNRRMIVGVIVAIAVMFGVLSLATMSSYNQGLVDGMARGTQIVVPNNNAQVMPAPQAPYVVQPQYASRPGEWGGPGFLGICFNVLVFVAIFFVITRVLRFAFGRRHWGAWGNRRGDWQKWHDGRNGPFNNNPRNAPNDFRNTPNKPDEQVI